MANYRKGVDAFRTFMDEGEAARNTGGRARFTRNIYWNVGDTKYIRFLSDIVPVLAHRKAFASEGRKKYPVNFISVEDPNLGLGLTAAENPLRPLGYVPKRDALAWAVELEPVKTGGKTTFEVASHTFQKKDGASGVEAHVGPIFESGFAFWTPLIETAELADLGEDEITQTIWVIKRTDQRTYAFNARNGQIDGMDKIPATAISDDDSGIPKDLQDYIDLISSRAFLDEKLPYLEYAFGFTPEADTPAPANTAADDELPFVPDAPAEKPAPKMADLRRKVKAAQEDA